MSHHQHLIRPLQDAQLAQVLNSQGYLYSIRVEQHQHRMDAFVHLQEATRLVVGHDGHDRHVRSVLRDQSREVGAGARG